MSGWSPGGGEKKEGVWSSFFGVLVGSGTKRRELLEGKLMYSFAFSGAISSSCAEGGKTSSPVGLAAKEAGLSEAENSSPASKKSFFRDSKEYFFDAKK